MPTEKKRINITVSDDMGEVLDMLAKRDNVSKSAKAVDLIKIAMEIDEDEALNAIAEKRDIKNAKFISHEQAWS